MARMKPRPIQLLANVWGFKCRADKRVPFTASEISPRTIVCQTLNKGGKPTGYNFRTAQGQFKATGKKPWSCTFEPIDVRRGRVESSEILGGKPVFHAQAATAALYAVECRSMKEAKRGSKVHE